MRPRIASLVITVDGCKAIKDADLASLFGVRLPAFYKRLGQKLWMLSKDMYFKLSPRYARGRLDAQPAARLHAERRHPDRQHFWRRRFAGNRHGCRPCAEKSPSRLSRQETPVRRKIDAEKAARYYEAMARMLQGRLHDMLKKMRH